MKIKFLLATFLFSTLYVKAQNLVQNPGFETVSTCPNNISQIAYALPWNNGSNTDYGTPEIYSNGGACNWMPSNNGQGTATAHTGNGLGGVFCYRTIALNREYLVMPLSSALTVGLNYDVSFWVRTSTNSKYSIDELGVYFSTTLPTCTDVSAPCNAASVLMSVTPQLKTTTNVFPNTTWQQFTFVYTATSAWQYITIGNFDSDATTGKSILAGASNFSYLLFDDVNVSLSSSLPIELIYFNGKCNNNNFCKLNWTTVSEINNMKFDVERSVDGINFKTIATIAGAGNSSVILNYSYTDNLKEIDDGIIYYRLHQTDLDGKNSYSDIVTINNCSSKNKSLVYPNPAKDAIYINGDDLYDNISIKLYDTIGRLVYNQNYASIKEYVVLPISDLSSGIYVLYVGEVAVKVVIE